MYKLQLMVTASVMLEMGTFPRHQFDKSGGSVGASADATWYINNERNDFASIEFEIVFYNLNYCLLAYTEHIFINRSVAPIPIGGLVRLKNDDIISIASYDLKVQFCTESSDNVNLQDELLNLLIATDLSSSPLNQIQQNNTYIDLYDINDFISRNSLLTLKNEKFDLDPLNFLENKAEKLSDNLDHLISLEVDYKGQAYKAINEYIDSNIESYEPILPDSDKDISNNLIYVNAKLEGEPIVCNEQRKTLTEKIDDNELNKSIILDPLYFIK